MKDTPRSLALASLIFGVLVAGLLYFFWPHAHWAVYLVVGLIVFGSLYKSLLEMAAHQKILSSGHDTKKDQ